MVLGLEVWADINNQQVKAIKALAMEGMAPDLAAAITEAIVAVGEVIMDID